MGEFSNQNVFISGATSGIGRAAAVAFGREGARVGIFGRNEEAALRVCGEITAAGGEGVVLTGDVRSKAAVDAAMALFLEGDRPLNLAVNAAGLDIVKAVTDYTEEEARAVLETNTLGAPVLPAGADSAHAGGGRRSDRERHLNRRNEGDRGKRGLQRK